MGEINLAILGCGPREMMNDIRYKAAVNDIDAHTEMFNV